MLEPRMPTIGIDFDGTIDDAPIFFKTLTKNWPGDILCITMRDDRKKIQHDLDELEIRVDDIILVNAFEEKAKVIKEHGVSIFFDDQDEILNHVDENVTVFKIRNGGNFDYDRKKWLYSKVTGIQL